MNVEIKMTIDYFYHHHEGNILVECYAEYVSASRAEMFEVIANKFRENR